MAFDGTEGDQITLQEANQLRQNYVQGNPGGAEGHYIGRDLIESILNQSGCKGISFYHGIDSNGKQNIILIGTDSNEADISSGIIADRGYPRP
jgi:hypothetical protein